MSADKLGGCLLNFIKMNLSVIDKLKIARKPVIDPSGRMLMKNRKIINVFA